MTRSDCPKTRSLECDRALRVDVALQVCRQQTTELGNAIAAADFFTASTTASWLWQAIDQLEHSSALDAETMHSFRLLRTIADPLLALAPVPRSVAWRPSTGTQTTITASEVQSWVLARGALAVYHPLLPATCDNE